MPGPTKVDTPAERLQDLDIARSSTTVVAVVESSLCVAIAEAAATRPRRSRWDRGDSGHDAVDVKVEDAVVDVDAGVRRGGRPQQAGVLLRLDDGCAQLLARGEGVLIGAGVSVSWHSGQMEVEELALNAAFPYKQQAATQDDARLT